MEISTENLTSGRSETCGNSRLLTVAVTSTAVLAVLAIFISSMSLGNTGPTTVNVSLRAINGSTGGDDKIWLLALHDWTWNFAYVDAASGEFRGLFIDMVDAVCQIANKNCQTVHDSSQRCWDSQPGSTPQGGEGLMGNYYDACVGWLTTYERLRTFRFSDQFTKLPSPLQSPVFITRYGNLDGFNWLNLTDTIIGFVDGYYYDEYCVARQDRIQGNDLSDDQIRHYPSAAASLQALSDGVIDAAFVLARHIEGSLDDFIVASDAISCAKSGLAVMTRKDNRLVDWWNPAFKKLRASPQWKDICDDLTEEHGHAGRSDATTCVGL